MSLNHDNKLPGWILYVFITMILAIFLWYKGCEAARAADEIEKEIMEMVKLDKCYQTEMYVNFFVPGMDKPYPTKLDKACRCSFSSTDGKREYIGTKQMLDSFCE
jgi:hypothetical protein